MHLGGQIGACQGRADSVHYVGPMRRLRIETGLNREHTARSQIDHLRRDGGGAQIDGNPQAMLAGGG